MGQFERTLIIADEAPTCTTSELHRARVLELEPPLRGRRLHRQARRQIRYTTVQNWSTNVFNLVTKRAVRAEADATVGRFGRLRSAPG